MRHAALLSLVPLLLLAAACSQAPPEPGAADAPPAPIVDQPDEAIPPATAPVPVPEPVAGPARFDGYAAMHFGMTEDAARAAMGGGLKQPPDTDPGDACHYVNPAGDAARPYLTFMFDGGRFVRYDVGNDELVAPGGGRRGMDEDGIRALYPGRVESSPHKYTDGRYLRIEDAGGEGVLVFETDGAGKVTEWHAGLPPQVDYVEGCS